MSAGPLRGRLGNNSSQAVWHIKRYDTPVGPCHPNCWEGAVAMKPRDVGDRNDTKLWQTDIPLVPKQDRYPPRFQ